MDIEIILASASPRRKELLEAAGVEFRVQATEVDEQLEPDLLANPVEAAEKLAERKAGAVVQEILADSDEPKSMIVLGADTIVVLDGEIFGKPRNTSDATRMLRKLSGRTHEVITAVSIWCILASEDEKVNVGLRNFNETSKVAIKKLDDEEIKDYLRKGESFDKAGAYAAQGAGKSLIENIEGDIDTVIGLPVKRLLAEFPALVNTD